MVNLLKDYPHLVEQVYEQDKYDLSCIGIDTTLVWVCSLGHVWESKVSNRIYSKTGCHYCSNRAILEGYNDLKTTHPYLAEEWSVKNDLKSTEVGAGSSTNFLWECPTHKHEWFSSPKTRVVMKTKCPVCSNRQVLVGFNDLTTTHPEIAAQWHPTRNNNKKPEMFTYGSKQKVWWLGECGHEWECVIKLRRTHNCAICTGKQVMVGQNDLQTTHPYLLEEWHPTKNTVLSLNVSSGSHQKIWWKCKQNHEWQATVKDRALRGQGCRECYLTRFVSEPEQEIRDYVSGLLGKDKVKGTVWYVIAGEVDIYIPEKKVAIEFNGLYWHSEATGKNKNYHYDKWKACKDKGIQLIQVWEDDYVSNPELVKRMLATKLGVSTERKIFARNTVVKALTQLQANEFLDEYHIQGAVDGGIRVGLFESNGDIGKLVAVMVLKREPGTEGKTLNLLRYATITNVIGGFTKLLKHVEKEFTPESIISFSDNAVSDGGLYENNGFIAVKELKPDYMYVVKGKRVHKFNYRLKRFREDPELMFEEGLSERELAALNKISRIWDAGKIKWEKKR